MTQVITPRDLLGKDPSEMTIAELLRTMAHICLPMGEDDVTALQPAERAGMYVSLMLEAARRDENLP